MWCIHFKEGIMNIKEIDGKDVDTALQRTPWYEGSAPNNRAASEIVAGWPPTRGKKFEFLRVEITGNTQISHVWDRDKNHPVRIGAGAKGLRDAEQHGQEKLELPTS